MTAQRDYRHVFGPVLSRRLGRSLGVDIMPFKTCTYDCVYCEQGRTTCHTKQRQEYVSTSEVLDELKDWLATRPAPDYVTLSGAGEPTLHAGLGDIVQSIKRLTEVPVAVITNGSLLWDSSVCDALREADVVLPSLDAGNAELFERIDRPVAGISFWRMVAGLISFRESFSNAIWLEVMLLAGFTSGESEVGEIAELVRQMRPDRIQLNTVARPPAESFALPIRRERLEMLAELFEPRADVIADYAGPAPETSSPDSARILELVTRRPCSMEELSATLSLRRVEALKLVQRLVDQQKIKETRFGADTFFVPLHEDSPGVTG